MTSKAEFPISLLFIMLLFFTFVGTIGAQDARSYYGRGAEALKAGDLHEAVHSFRSALNSNPAYLEAQLGMIEALFLLTEFDEAYREVESAHVYAQGNRELSLLEARILVALGEDEKAAEIYMGILENRPHDAEANRGLAEYYAINGQKELAERTFDRSLQYSPGDKRVLMHLVLLHDDALDREKSEPVLLELLRLFPNDYYVRILAAEHYALYEEWMKSAENLTRVKSMIDGPDDPRYRRMAMLDASIALRMGNPESALESLRGVEKDVDPGALFLLARASRAIGNEEKAQAIMERLISIRPDDEIIRMFREEYLVRTTTGFETYRKDAASRHINAGRRYEESYYYNRALSEYRRARLVDGTNPNVWITYAELIRKMGFPEKYRDALEGALFELEGTGADSSGIRRKISLLDHSRRDGIASDWGYGDDPWKQEPAAWKIAVFVNENDQSLPYHSGAAPTLGYFFADEVDLSSRLKVVNTEGGFGLEIETVDSFAEAFRKSRGKTDYFVLVNFFETERSFGASADLYLSRTGERIGLFGELRTGRGMVGDTLSEIVKEMESAVPDKMRILAIDGNRLLLDKGLWYDMTTEEPLLVLRKGKGRPGIVENGIEYDLTDFLGTATIERISESLCEALFEKAGDFNFVSPGDEVFLLPVPEIAESDSVLDPAFRNRLLSVP